MQYRREIDGLRAIAVLPVILWHAGLALQGGFVGVDVFFVISGFLIATILQDDLANGRFSILSFYERRARRILPALFLVIVVSYPFAWAWMQPDALTGYSASIAAATFFVSNLYFWQSTSYFSITDMQLPLLHTWSLAVEEQFYLIFPLMLLGLWRLPARPRGPVLLLCALASLALSGVMQRRAPEANFYLTPTRAWELLAGSAAALMIGAPALASTGAALAQIASAAGLAMVLLPFGLYNRYTPGPSAYTLVPVLGAVLVLLFARTGTVVAAILSWRPLVGIGMISYSAYLWHQPIFALARIRAYDPPSRPLMVGLSLLALALAALSWRFVERPFRQKNGAGAIPARRLWQFVCGGAVGLAVLSAVALFSRDAPFRFVPEVQAMNASFSALFKERLREGRVGQCEFNSKITAKGLDAFLADWSCLPHKSGPLADSRIAIFGDSHSTDIAMAMRLNGLDVVHISGAGCPLSPDLMPGKCRTLADFMKAKLVETHVTDLWLVERFEPRELRPQDLVSLTDYWRQDGVAVTVFSPMPEFPEMKERMIKAVWLHRPATLIRDRTAEDAFFAPATLAAFKAASVRVIDTGALFCSAMPDCQPMDGPTPLMTDGQHLAVAGALRFGAALVAELGVK